MFDSSMELPDFFRNGHRPPFLLGQAYAVLTGNSASPGEHLSKELIESRLAASFRAFLAEIHHDIGVDVAVSSVAKAGYRQSVFFLQMRGEGK